MMMNLNIPFIGSSEVMSLVFKVYKLTNGTDTKVFLTEKEKTVFSLFQGVILCELDEPHRDFPLCYFAQLDTSQENPKGKLLFSVFDEFLPLYYNDYAHLYNVSHPQRENKEDEIIVPLWDRAFNADEKPSKSVKEVS